MIVILVFFLSKTLSSFPLSCSLCLLSPFSSVSWCCCCCCSVGGVGSGGDIMNLFQNAAWTHRSVVSVLLKINIIVTDCPHITKFVCFQDDIPFYSYGEKHAARATRNITSGTNTSLYSRYDEWATAHNIGIANRLYISQKLDQQTIRYITIS